MLTEEPVLVLTVLITATTQHFQQIKDYNSFLSLATGILSISRYLATVLRAML